MINNKVIKNATWIIICRIIQSILSVFITMLSARYLGPSNYGLISYAGSLVAFVVPIMQLGLTAVLVQELVAFPEQEGKILGTAIAMNFFSSFLCIGGVLVFSVIANHGEKITIVVCALYSILLVFQALETIQYWFQAKLQSKYVSIVSLIAYVIISAYKIFLLLRGHSVYWFAISHALDYGIIAFLLFIIYKKLGGQRLIFSKEHMKRMFGKSRHYIVSSLMVTIFAQTDRIMIKLMLGNIYVGYYSAAITCATMSGFVFSAIIDSARPSIFESQKENAKLFEKNISRLYSVIIYLSLLQCIFITLLAPLIIQILYGKEYMPSVNALQLVVWYTTFSYLGSVRNIWILAENKQRYLWILNLSGAGMNVVLNALLIPVLGIMGAAFASLVTQIFTNVIMNMIVYPIRRNNLLMLKALNPKLLVDMIKTIRSKRK